MQRILQAFGADISIMSETGHSRTLRIRGFGAAPRCATGSTVNAGNAGAVLRLILAIASLLPEIRITTDRPDSLGKRPNADLLHALQQLGCRCSSQNGMLPIQLQGGNLHGGKITVSGARSSQFLSSLLFLAPLIGETVEISVTDGLVSKAPVRQTLEVLQLAGIQVQHDDSLLSFRIDPQSYQPGTRTVNGDWPGSAAILAAAAVCNSDVTIRGLMPDNQGEREAANVLKQMGANIVCGADFVRVTNGDGLNAVEFNGDIATDAVLALAGAACFCSGRSRFYNIANLRIKECDRITEPLAQLRAIGVQCSEGRESGDSDPDAMLITGNPLGYHGGITVSGRKDHRVIMLETIVGLRCRDGLKISGAEHVAKSYPAFFEHLGMLGARIKLETATQ
jgi:3-phosphoshikimate 1-carboxyvinyltransferase